MMLSDGIPEAVLPDGSPLGYDWLLDRLERISNVRDPAERLDALMKGLTVEVGERPEDDWTLLLLERGARADSAGPPTGSERSHSDPPGSSSGARRRSKKSARKRPRRKSAKKS